MLTGRTYGKRTKNYIDLQFMMERLREHGRIVALRKLCVIELFDSPLLKVCSFSGYWPLFLPIYIFLENSLMIGVRKGSKEH